MTGGSITAFGAMWRRRQQHRLQSNVETAAAAPPSEQCGDGGSSTVFRAMWRRRQQHRLQSNVETAAAAPSSEQCEDACLMGCCSLACVLIFTHLWERLELFLNCIAHFTPKENDNLIWVDTVPNIIIIIVIIIIMILIETRFILRSHEISK